MNNPMPVERNYIAFISYRHLPLDREAAVSIQKKIESYVVPKEYRAKVGGKKLGACFRDEDELPASSSLSQSITYALDRSQYLIVICTPDLPLSRWCMAEIDYFLRTHDRDHVLAVLADGTPNVSFPDQLRFVRDARGNILSQVEPLAANVAGPNHSLNKKTLKKEATRLIAAMLGCPFDALWQREHRANTIRLLIAMAVMAVFIGVVLVNNIRISKQNRELEKKMSTALVDSGISALENLASISAIQDALNALESGDPDIYDHRAEKLLADSLGAYSPIKPKNIVITWQTSEIKHISASEDGRIIFFSDPAGNIRAMNNETGNHLWDVFLNTREAPRLYPVGNDRLLCKSDEALTALSMKDGSILWAYEYSYPNAYQVISDDGSMFAIIDDPVLRTRRNQDFRNKAALEIPWLSILDTMTGEKILYFSLFVSHGRSYIDLNTNIYDFGGDFSDDNTCFAIALPTKEDDRQSMEVVFFDLTFDYVCKYIGSFAFQPDMVLGMEIAADNESTYIALAKDSLLYSAILYTDHGREDLLHTFDYTALSPNGVSDDYLYAERPYLPMLTSSHLAVLISQNTIYIMDRFDGSLRGTLGLDSAVCSAVWLSRRLELLEVCTRNGHVVNYMLTYGTESVLNDYYSYDVPLSDITSAYRIYSSPGSITTDLLLAVTASQPGVLQGIVQAADPEYRDCAASHSTSCVFAEPTPSGDRMMLFYPVRNEETKMLVETLDIRTGELCEQVTIDLAPQAFPKAGSSPIPLPTDDSHFLLYGYIYGMDGSVVDRALIDSRRLDYQSVVLEDGRLFFAYLNVSTSLADMTTDYVTLHWQIDEEKEPYKEFLENSLTREIGADDPAKHFAVGKNGWLALWGKEMLPGENRLKPVFSDQMSIVAVNTKTGEHVDVNDEYAEIPVLKMALSNKNAWLVSVYENGTVVLYDLLGKVTHILPDDYARGEVRDICFSDGDAYLLVLTASGKVDVYTMDPIYGVTSLSQCFAAPDQNLIDWFRAEEDPENDRLILTAANESGTLDPQDPIKAQYWTTVLDTSTWEITAQPDHVCCWSARHGQTVFVDGTTLGTCKVRSLKDLMEWGRAELDRYWGNTKD